MTAISQTADINPQVLRDATATVSPTSRGEALECSELVLTLQLATLLLVALPLLALLRPFIPQSASALALAISLSAVAIAFWRSTAELQGHVRAGASAIVEALAAQARGSPTPDTSPLLPAAQLLPGLGMPEAVRLHPDSAAVGRTLSSLDLCGLTGATVLAITRGDRAIVLPTASEKLEAGDLLAVAGTRESLTAAKALLEQGAVALDS